MREHLSITVAALLGLSLLACGPAANPAEDGDDDGNEPAIRLPPGGPSGFDCKDVPETGICQDDVAVYCDKRSSTIVSKRCAARSLTCEDSSIGARCVDGDGVEQDVPGEVEGPTSANDTGEDCDVYDYIGDCEGNTLKYCTKADTLYVEDCGEINGVCEFVANGGYYACMPPDDCNAEGDVCEGNAIKTCTIGSSGWEIDLWGCNAGETCVEADGFASCEALTAPTCEDLGFDGKCLDSSGQISEFSTKQLAYCDGDEIVHQTCEGSDVCVDPDGSGFVECGAP